MSDLIDHKDNSSFVSQRPGRLSALSHLFIGVGLLIVSVSIFYFLGDKLISKTARENTFVLQLFTFITSTLGFIVAAYVLSLVAKADFSLYYSFRKPNKPAWFGLAIAFGICCIPLIKYLTDLNGSLDIASYSTELAEKLKEVEDLSNSLYDRLSDGSGFWFTLSTILFMAFLPALAEEMFFRGFIQNSMRGIVKNPHIAIWLTAIAFALIHFQVMKILPMIFMGGVFGYLVYWTNSIWTAVIAHFLNNAMAVILLVQNTDQSYEDMVKAEGEISPIVTIIISVVAILLFVYLQAKTKPKAENFYE